MQTTHLFSCVLQVLEGSAVVLGQVVPVEVHEAQAKFRATATAIRPASEPLQGRMVVRGHARAGRIHVPQLGLGLGVASLSSLPVALQAVSSYSHMPQQHQGIMQV